MNTKASDKTYQLIIESTADGSNTLYIPELKEHYHSTNGARQEALIVYIDAALKQIQKDEINVFEVGFGTGLNALLTSNYALENRVKINYYSIEAYPISLDLVISLNNTINKEEQENYKKIHEATWNTLVEIHPYFEICKIHEKLNILDISPYLNKIDCIYFDAFAPSVQEDMWTEDIFNKMYTICSLNGVLSTYCAKGEVRRRMQRAGFTIERLPGPPGKREILRATKTY